MKTRNYYFQWLWYNVVKWLIPVRRGFGPERSHYRIMAQYYLARLFGKIDFIMYGDSEIAMFASFDTMKNFSGITPNFGEGGTTPLDWVLYFRGTGKTLLNKIYKNKKVVSIGGNCSLLNQMFQIPKDLQLLHDMTGKSAILLVPPVYCKWLSAISQHKTPAQFEYEIATIRSHQMRIWQWAHVDTFTPLLNAKTGTSKFWALQDPVHFSKFSVALIQKVLDKMM